MRKTTKKNNSLILVCVGVMVFVALYMIVISPLQLASTQLQDENTFLAADVMTYEEYERNGDEYDKQIAISKQYVQEQLLRYPADVTPEDVIMWTLSLQNTTNSQVTSISFSPATQILQFVASTEVGGQDVSTNMSAYSTSSSFNSTYSYGDLKNALDFIYDSQHRTSAESVNIAYDPSSSLLNVTMNVNKYFVTYPEAVYTPLPLPNVAIGTPNPFGSSAGATE